ncbi:unnamed protein product [Rotaria sp. Silwood2]|nr:unnamed protein product [Rotaria sp. Silwood2]
MCKELILTEQEKKARHFLKLAKEQLNKIDPSNNQQSLITLPTVVRKKKRLMIKSTSQEVITYPIYKMHYFGYNHILYDDDRTLLNNINNIYQSIVDKNDYSYINKYTSSTTLSQFINDETVMHESLIHFFKSIPEFRQLDMNDQILLIKSNFINIIHLHHVMVYNFQDCSNLDKRISKWISKDFDYQILRTRRYFYRFMNCSLLLKLTLVVFIFSINLSASFDINQSYHYKNKKILLEFQNFYTNILRRYLNYLFDEKEAIQIMQIIVMQILRYQLLMVTMMNSVRQSSDCYQFHSLMQSILGLT